MIVAACLLLGSIGRNPLVTIDVDAIELNHTPRFSQVIIWRWSEDYLRYDCQDYWLLQNDDLQGYPTRCGGFTVAEHRGLRYRTKQFIERWTKNDPERDNASLFPQAMRCER